MEEQILGRSYVQIAVLIKYRRYINFVLEP